MRINFVLPPDGLFGGIRVLAIYAQRLAARGHAVTVVQPRHPAVSWRETFRSLRHGKGWPKDGNRAQVSYFDTLRHEKLRRMVLAHAGPVEARDVPDGDVVVASWWETAEWVWALPASKGVKAHFMQDYEIWGGNEPRVDATCRLAMPKIVIAQWVADLLREKFGQTPAALIPNAVDTTLFSAAARGKQPSPTIGFTYTPMHNKGVDVAIAAIERARQEVPGLKVKAFGSMPVARELPLPAETEFSFRVPDEALPGIYAGCDAWLFGTRVEGFGLPLLEAMACRTPVIGTPAGAAPELIGRGGGGGGILVGREDSAGMAAAIVRVAKMPESEWRAMSDRSYATAHGYSWEDATDRMETALIRLAGSAGRKEP